MKPREPGNASGGGDGTGGVNGLGRKFVGSAEGAGTGTVWLSAKRPLLPVACWFAGGILTADQLALSLAVLFALSFGLAVTAIVWARRREIALCGLLFAAGATRQTMELAALSPIDLRNIQPALPELVTVVGRLKDTPRERLVEIRGGQSWRSRAVVEVEAIRRPSGLQPASGLITAQAGDLLPSDFFGGRAVEIEGVLKPPPGPLAEGLFDYRNHLRREGICFELDARPTNSWRLRTDTPQPARPPFSDRFLAWSRKTLALGQPEEDLPLRLNWAMTLDWKGAFTEKAAEPFLAAGTYHIFAVDGLRMGLITAIFLGLLRVLRIPRGLAGLLVIPVLWFYVMTTGWAASAVRATVMMSVILAGWAGRRPSDLLNSMCGAAFLILAWQPQQLFQAGFQLSFVVVACIGLLSPVFRKIELRKPDPLALPQANNKPEWLAASLRFVEEIFVASIVSWLGSIPLSAYYFNLFSLASVPANLLVVPLCVLCLICDLGSLVVGAALPSVSILFNHSAWLLMKLIALLSQWSARLPSGAWHVAVPSLVAICLYYTVLLAVMTGWIFKAKRKGAVWALIVILAVAWGCERLEARRTISLHLLSDRGAEIALLQQRGGREPMLLNTGRSNTVERLLKPFLHAQGIDRFPILALNHGDAARAGGLQAVEESFHPSIVFTGPARPRSAAFARLRAAPKDKRREWKQVTMDQAAGPWSVLHPPAGVVSPRAENDALVLRGEFYGTKVLVLSNLGRDGQRALLENNDELRANLVLISLPPGSPPPLDALLRAIQPDEIIVDDGEPGVGFRAPDSWHSQLRAWSARTLWFHDTGSIKLEFKPRGWAAFASDHTELAHGSTGP